MRFLFLLILFAILSSCFGPVKELKYQIEDSMAEDEPITEPVKIKKIAQTKSAEILWQSNIKGDLNEGFNLFYRDEKLFVLSTNGILTAFNHSDGEEIWSKNFNTQIASGISGNDSILVFTTNDGYIFAVDLKGSLVWKTFFGKVISSPLVLENKIIVRRDDNNFAGMDIQEGSIDWTYQAPSSSLTINAHGKMIYADGVVYSGLPSAKLIALEAETGLLIWEANVSTPKGVSEIDRVSDITSQPIVDNSLIFTVSMNGDIACLDRKTSEILWSRPLSSFAGITDHLDEVLVIHKRDSIYSLDKLTGKSLWRNADLIGRSLTSGVVVDDFFIVADYEGFVHTININSGKIIGRAPLSSKDKVLNNILTVEGQFFYVASIKGDIHKLQLIDVDIPMDINNSESENEDYEDSTTLKLFDKLKDAILD